MIPKIIILVIDIAQSCSFAIQLINDGESSQNKNKSINLSKINVKNTRGNNNTPKIILNFDCFMVIDFFYKLRK